MIFCNCYLAGTAACQTCQRNPNAKIDPNIRITVDTYTREAYNHDIRHLVKTASEQR